MKRTQNIRLMFCIRFIFFRAARHIVTIRECPDAHSYTGAWKIGRWLYLGRLRCMVSDNRINRDLFAPNMIAAGLSCCALIKALIDFVAVRSVARYPHCGTRLHRTNIVSTCAHILQFVSEFNLRTKPTDDKKITEN